MYFLVSGRVTASMRKGDAEQPAADDDDGEGKVQAAGGWGVGDLFGEEALIDDEFQWPFTARASSTTVLLVLEQNAFERVLASQPALSQEVGGRIAAVRLMRSPGRLHQVWPLSGVDALLVAKLVGRLGLRACEPKETLFDEDVNPCNALTLLAVGALRVVYRKADGTDVTAFLSAGAAVGEHTLLLSSLNKKDARRLELMPPGRPVFASTQEACVLLELDESVLTDVISEEPGMRESIQMTAEAVSDALSPAQLRSHWPLASLSQSTLETLSERCFSPTAVAEGTVIAEAGMREQGVLFLRGEATSMREVHGTSYLKEVECGELCGMDSILDPPSGSVFVPRKIEAGSLSLILTLQLSDFDAALTDDEKAGACAPVALREAQCQSTILTAAAARTSLGALVHGSRTILVPASGSIFAAAGTEAGSCLFCVLSGHVQITNGRGAKPPPAMTTRGAWLVEAGGSAAMKAEEGVKRAPDALAAANSPKPCIVLMVRVAARSAAAEAAEAERNAKLQAAQEQREAEKAELRYLETQLARLEYRLGIRRVLDPRQAWQRALRKMRIIQIISGISLDKLNLHASERASVSLSDEIYAIQQRRVDQLREVQRREDELTKIAEMEIEMGVGELPGEVHEDIDMHNLSLDRLRKEALEFDAFKNGRATRRDTTLALCRTILKDLREYARTQQKGESPSDQRPATSELDGAQAEINSLEQRVSGRVDAKPLLELEAALGRLRKRLAEPTEHLREQLMAVMHQLRAPEKEIATSFARVDAIELTAEAKFGRARTELAEMVRALALAHAYHVVNMEGDVKTQMKAQGQKTAAAERDAKAAKDDADAKAREAAAAVQAAERKAAMATAERDALSSKVAALAAAVQNEGALTEQFDQMQANLATALTERDELAATLAKLTSESGSVGEAQAGVLAQAQDALARERSESVSLRSQLATSASALETERRATRDALANAGGQSTAVAETEKLLADERRVSAEHAKANTLLQKELDELRALPPPAPVGGPPPPPPASPMKSKLWKKLGVAVAVAAEGAMGPDDAMLQQLDELDEKWDYMLEPDRTRDLFRDKIEASTRMLARQLIKTKFEDLTAICESDALYWYLWRYVAKNKLKMNDLFELIKRSDVSVVAMGAGGGVTADCIEGFLSTNRVPHTEAALRFLLSSLGLPAKDPNKMSMTTKSLYFKEFLEAFQKNQPAIFAKPAPKLKRSNATKYVAPAAAGARPTSR